MKYLNYDSNTAKVIGFYSTDIHGDNIPVGCIEISDDVWGHYIENQNKYVVNLSKASAIIDGTEIKNFEDIFIEVQISLDNAKNDKIQ